MEAGRFFYPDRVHKAAARSATSSQYISRKFNVISSCHIKGVSQIGGHILDSYSMDPNKEKTSYKQAWFLYYDHITH
jgi:hypothetical protein